MKPLGVCHGDSGGERMTDLHTRSESPASLIFGSSQKAASCPSWRLMQTVIRFKHRTRVTPLVLCCGLRFHPQQAQCHYVSGAKSQSLRHTSVSLCVCAESNRMCPPACRNKRLPFSLYGRWMSVQGIVGLTGSKITWKM